MDGVLYNINNQGQSFGFEEQNPVLFTASTTKVGPSMWKVPLATSTTLAKPNSWYPVQILHVYAKAKASENLYTRQVGAKAYELVDHLGNVTVTVSDLKRELPNLYLATYGVNAPLGMNEKVYAAQVLSYTNYYAFGMNMPGRNKTSEAYRYGFNGKENDKEWGTGGLTQDYGFRMYNPAIAKFLSVDPLADSYPWYTPYQFAGNSPIKFIDLDGLEPAPSPGGAAPLFGNADYHHTVFDQGTTKQKEKIAAYGTVGALLIAGALYTGGRSLQALPYLARSAMYNPQLYNEIGAGVYGLAGGDDEWPGAISDNIAKSSKLRYSPALLSKKPCGCFTAGTLVLTSNGYKSIEEILVGDSVWAYNDTTKFLEKKKVINTFTRNWSAIYKIDIEGLTIEATGEHPFFIEGRWINAELLKVGDLLTVYDGSIRRINGIDYIKGDFKVYNFTVEGFHTYYVSKYNVLVHNGNPCSFLASFKAFKPLQVADEYKGVIQGGAKQAFEIVDQVFKINGKNANGAFDYVILKTGEMRIGAGHYHLSDMADEILAAGKIDLKDGKIDFLINDSGHYRPSGSDLANYANTFTKEGLMSETVQVFKTH